MSQARRRPGYLILVSAVFMLASCSSSDNNNMMSSSADPPCSDNTGNRFVDCGNGTVTDSTTGLVWLKDASCFADSTFADANAAAAQLAAGQCGLSDGSSAGDWRLPSLACPTVDGCLQPDATGEFAAILDRGCNPNVPDTAGTGCWSEGDPFSGVQTDDYWSSTVSAFTPAEAWTAGIGFGDVIDRDQADTEGVWAVRN